MSCFILCHYVNLCRLFFILFSIYFLHNPPCNQKHYYCLRNCIFKQALEKLLGSYYPFVMIIYIFLRNCQLIHECRLKTMLLVVGGDAQFYPTLPHKTLCAPIPLIIVVTLPMIRCGKILENVRKYYGTYRQVGGVGK